MSGDSELHRTIRKLNLIGLGTVAILVLGVGGWAAMAQLSGAVIASGICRRRIERQESAAPERRHRRTDLRQGRQHGGRRPGCRPPRRHRAARQPWHHPLAARRTDRTACAPDRRTRQRRSRLSFPDELTGARRRNPGGGRDHRRAEAVRSRGANRGSGSARCCRSASRRSPKKSADCRRSARRRKAKSA